MTNTEPHLSRGDQYIVFYKGGPYDGSSDKRISTNGSWDESVTVLVSLDGKETQVVYANPIAHAVGSQVQVTYSWDVADSEPLEDPDERRD
jgi:hypothetical protein